MVYRTLKISGIGSYLSKWEQEVFVNGVESDFLSVNFGVRYGSTLGPFLFLVCYS